MTKFMLYKAKEETEDIITPPISSL